MDLFKWKDSFSVGVQIMDDQHKHLVDMLNTLYNAMKVGKARDVIGDILNKLSTYTENHFATEEKLMVQNNYLESIAHKGEHNKLMKDVKEFKEKFEAGEATLTIELMNYLRDWLTQHIQVTDKKFGQYLNQKGVK